MATRVERRRRSRSPADPRSSGAPPRPPRRGGGPAPRSSSSSDASERPLVELGAVGRVGRDLERLLEERERLLVGRRARPRAPRRLGARSAPGRPARRPPPRPRRAAGRRGSGRRGRRRARRCRGSRSSAPRRGGGLAVLLRQRVVGDLADERLDERVLAALGRARVDRRGEELAPDERPRAAARASARGTPETAARPADREALAEHRGVLDERPVGRRRGRRAGRR